jgi:AraC family transcriptional regulator
VLETPGVRVDEMAYAKGLCVARHSHETANVIYTISGTHWSSYSRGGDACPPGSVRFLPAGEPHENYFPVDSRCLGIEVRQSIFDLADEHGGAKCVPGEIGRSSAAGLGHWLYREFRRADDLSALAIESAALELVLSGRPERHGRMPAWLLRIREMLHEQTGTRVTLAELSREVGRHPVQISRQFHQYFGCTISEYVRRVRIARAQSLLARGQASVAEIALACGFCDQSHFTTAFRRLSGVPPRQWVIAKK